MTTATSPVLVSTVATTKVTKTGPSYAQLIAKLTLLHSTGIKVSVLEQKKFAKVQVEGQKGRMYIPLQKNGITTIDLSHFTLEFGAVEIPADKRPTGKVQQRLSFDGLSVDQALDLFEDSVRTLAGLPVAAPTPVVDAAVPLAPMPEAEVTDADLEALTAPALES